jgi:indolepyruvate ferredoxin oxidoreductase
MAPGRSATIEGGITLDDKWTVRRGRALLNGVQAIARALIAQKELDARRGLRTAGYITGYRGSPLGGVDNMLWSIAGRLKDAEITFQPGVNEDIAVTAVHGTQQIDAVPGATHEGVFASWYGKGPGVDRSGDALKHGNFAGAHRNGGVVLFYGDDHAGSSSTVSHQSEQALSASLIPSLYPADVGEVLAYGLLGFALSRYSGSWVGVKCVNEVVEQTKSVDLDLDAFETVSPDPGVLPPEGVHIRSGVLSPLRDEVVVTDFRLPLVHRFVRANGIDRVIFRATTPRLGLVAAGKSYQDLCGALALLGLDAPRAAELGISLYKVGCIWPLEPEGLTDFAAGHETLLVVEEKKSFVESQAAALLINQLERSLIVGKRDREGRPLLDATLPLAPRDVARAIARILDGMGIDIGAERLGWLGGDTNRLAEDSDPVAKRIPYFCSGCPHNRSTRIPDGSLSMTGIGCHGMVNFVRPEEALTATQMGGEGGNWIGLAPFTQTRHIFQNMGDGTYYHSGLLAIRAAVASGVNITYKILYNDAVAMTGGQPVDGPISVAEIIHQVRHEGVRKIVLVSDNPALHRANAALLNGVDIYHRDDLDAVQREMREIPGCTVLIYEQTCAAEKRRRRKRNRYPDPPKRLFIAKEVCEACGDCSVQSTCVSLVPVATPFGVKRSIDQTSCNKDYSCLNGFCPSFITIEGAEPRKPKRDAFDASFFADLGDTSPAAIGADRYDIILAGIGGTGVITVGAILGMAAHIDGLAVSLFDMTGLAQKNGAVYSHVRVAASPDRLHIARIGAGEADTLLAFDLVAALGNDSAAMLRESQSHAVVNSDVSSTANFQFDRDSVVRPELLLARLNRLVGADGVLAIAASNLAEKLLGSTVASNMILLGAAAERSLLPISLAAIEQAIRLNGTGVQANLDAFRVGRLMVRDPQRIVPLLSNKASDASPVPESLEALVAHRAEHLEQYQDAAYAARYRELVALVSAREEQVCAGSRLLTMAAARSYAHLLAYKDEYEVARLLTSPSLQAEIRRSFADGGKMRFNLAPPILGGRMSNGRPRKRAFDARLVSPLLGLVRRMKWLRGTAFDPFGMTTERRMERRLIAEYEALVGRCLARLDAVNIESLTVLLGQALEVRGFGPVKEAAVARYYSAVVEQESLLNASYVDRVARPSAA